MTENGARGQGSGHALDRLVWPLLAASSALYFLSDNEADNDLWVHLLAGKEILRAGALPRTDAWSFTSAGSPWVDHEWLAQLLFAAVFDAASDTGLWLLKLAIGFVMAAVIWLSLGNRDKDTAADRPIWLRASVLLVVVAVCGRGFAIRPQIFTYLGTAILLYWLDRQPHPGHADAPVPPNQGKTTGGFRIWIELLAVLIGFALWANVHGGFVFGLGVLGLYAALPPWAAWTRRGSLAAAAVAGSCINPYGASLLWYIGHELQTPHPITEWQAATPGDPALLTYFVVLIVFLITLPFARWLVRRPWHAAVIAAVIIMSLRHQRHAPLLALCCAVPLTDQLASACQWLKRKTGFELSPPAWRILQVGVAVVALLQLALGGLRLAGDGPHVMYDAAEYPVGAMRYLRTEGLSGNLALPLDWGAFALWHGTPAVRVSLDGRFATVYPPHVVQTNFAFFGDGTEATGGLIEEHGATMALVPRGLRTPAHVRPDWRVRYADDVAELLVAGTEGAPVIGRTVTGRLRFP